MTCHLVGSKAVARFLNRHLKTWKILFTDLPFNVKEDAAICFDWHQKIKLYFFDTYQ
jgi:hypothetical protein